jgi:hypothetical protein
MARVTAISSSGRRHLKVWGSFEAAVKRGRLRNRSGELSKVLAKLEYFQKSPTQMNLIVVSRAIQDWESSHQREVINRGGDELAHLKAAIDEEFEVVYHTENPVTIHNMRSESDGNSEAVPINNWRRVKMGMPVAKTPVTTALSVTQLAVPATSTLEVAGAIAGGTSVAAGPIAIASAATIAMIGSSALAGRAAYKTQVHIFALHEIWRNAGNSPYCDCNPLIPGEAGGAWKEHSDIVHQVLPYIIDKKAAKAMRKGVSVVPGMALAEAGRAVIKMGWKSYKGTLGKARLRNAGIIARHFITCDCELSRRIIGELYSYPEALWLQEQNYETVVYYVSYKMKST